MLLSLTSTLFIIHPSTFPNILHLLKLKYFPFHTSERTRFLFSIFVFRFRFRVFPIKYFVSINIYIYSVNHRKCYRFFCFLLSKIVFLLVPYCIHLYWLLVFFKNNFKVSLLRITRIILIVNAFVIQLCISRMVRNKI